MEMGGNHIEFVQAMPEDANHLRTLARKSEAHWGYGEEFMGIFDRVFNVTEQFISENPVYVLWRSARPAAFWGIRADADGWELEYFYVADCDLGKGYGRKMWNHMINWCRKQEVRNIHFVTSPQATGFYERMGAIRDKMTLSIIDGRPIPHFVYRIANGVSLI